MSLRDTTPLGEITGRGVANIKLAIRQIYIGYFGYLVALSNQFSVNEARMIEMDRNNSWPEYLEGDYSRDPNYLNNLITYNHVQLDSYITRNGNMYLKFPTVELKVRQISRYTTLRWARQQSSPRYYPMEGPTHYELIAFQQNRLPTKEEILNLDFVHSNTKRELNTIFISLNGEQDIIAVVDEAYKKYLSSNKRAGTCNVTSRDSVYKKYLKLRGNPAFKAYTTSNKVADTLSTITAPKAV